MRHIALSAVFLFAFSGLANADWRATFLSDDFTDQQVCRVEPHGQITRGILRGLIGSGITYHFFVETRGGEVLAGVRSEPEYPIPGDVQIRVGSNEAILLGADAAVSDGAPGPRPNSYVRPEASEEERAAIESAINTAYQAAASAQAPARALRGEVAMDLLNQIASGDRVIFRVVGSGGRESGVGEFHADNSFFRALLECGIDLGVELETPERQPVQGLGDDYD